MLGTNGARMSGCTVWTVGTMECLNGPLRQSMWEALSIQCVFCVVYFDIRDLKIYHGSSVQAKIDSEELTWQCIWKSKPRIFKTHIVSGSAVEKHHQTRARTNLSISFMLMVSKYSTLKDVKLIRCSKWCFSLQFRSVAILRCCRILSGEKRTIPFLLPWSSHHPYLWNVPGRHHHHGCL